MPPIDRDKLIVGRVEHCSACGTGELTTIAALPDLPITGRFSPSAMTESQQGIDQELLWCDACGHGQLLNHVAPDVLYDSSYGFRTSSSATARRGTRFFLDTLEEIVPGRNFNCAVDVGCNDLFLLESLSGRAERRVGVDPIWAGKEDEAGGEIEVIGSTAEGADLVSYLGQAPDLITLRHTIEHIDQPIEVLRSLVEAAADDAIIMIETPGFDNLIRRGRFDQVFHQHVQYFTLGSMQTLMAGIGAEFVGYRENYHDWGAIAVVFRKTSGRTSAQQKSAPAWEADDLVQRYRSFRSTMQLSGSALQALHDEGPVYGYGAGNMLSVLSYHLGTDLAFLTSVLDDDPSKDGMHYWNLPLGIQLPSESTDLSDASVLITAVDNVKPIMTRLFEARPRHIVYPLAIM